MHPDANPLAGNAHSAGTWQFALRLSRTSSIHLQLLGVSRAPLFSRQTLAPRKDFQAGNVQSLIEPRYRQAQATDSPS